MKLYFFSKSVVMNTKREHGPVSGDTSGKLGNKIPKQRSRRNAERNTLREICPLNTQGLPPQMMLKE